MTVVWRIWRSYVTASLIAPPYSLFAVHIQRSPFFGDFGKRALQRLHGRGHFHNMVGI